MSITSHWLTWPWARNAYQKRDATDVEVVTGANGAMDVNVVSSVPADPASLVNGTTTAITDGTSTQVLAAGAASIRNYVTSVLVTNSHATQGTFVKILDGSTILLEGYAAAAGGGFAIALPAPLKGTAATAINAQCVTAGANVIVSCAGYTGA